MSPVLAALMGWAEVGGYVIVAWVLGVAAVGGYALSVVRKGRRLSRQVPPESRRWM